MYSIYCIACKDLNVKEVYIGSTKNINKRWNQHKHNCQFRPHAKVYKFINENGGINNWEIEELETCDLGDRYLLERKHIDENINNLNSRLPLTEDERLNYKLIYNEKNKIFIKRYKKEYRKKMYYCSICDTNVCFNNRGRHFKTEKHIINSSI